VEHGENAHRDSTIYYVDENQKILGILKKMWMCTANKK
jgi:hypothetical protein